MEESEPPPTANVLASGQRLGRYRLERRLGTGGMGEVWQAFDEVTPRRVAVKTVRTGRDPWSAHGQRLRREARALAALDHPNIPQFHEILDTGHGTYLVLELIRGVSLAARLLDGPLPQAEVISIGRQVAAALEAAHGLQIVHRDLKAENVLVTPAGRAVVLDFGLVKSYDPDRTEDSLTEDGVVMGTSRSMSPEQARGLPVEAASDLFALGSLLYELATGRHPFQAATPLETMERVVRSHPRGVRDLRPELSSALEALISRLLAKDPAERPVSAGDVRRILEGLEPFERPTETFEGAPVPMVQHPSHALRWGFAIVGVVALIALGIGVTLRPSSPPFLVVALAPPEFRGVDPSPGVVLAASEAARGLLTGHATFRPAHLPDDPAVARWSSARMLRAASADALLRVRIGTEGSSAMIEVEWWTADRRDDADAPIANPADPQQVFDAVSLAGVMLGPLGARSPADTRWRLPTEDLTATSRLLESCDRVELPIEHRHCAERLLGASSRSHAAVVVAKAAQHALATWQDTGDLGLVVATRRRLVATGCPERCDPRLILSWLRVELTLGRSPDALEREVAYRESVRGPGGGRPPSWLDEVVAAELALARDRPDVGRAHLEAALQLAPGVADLEREQAHLELLHGDAARAEERLRRLVEHGGAVSDRCLLASARHVRGDPTAARETLLTGLASDSWSDPRITIELATLGDLRGDADESRRLARTTLELLEQGGWGPAGEGGMLRARALALVGACGPAVEALRPLLAAGEHDAGTALAAAELLDRCGDRVSAEVQLRNAARLGVADAWLGR